MVRCWAGFASLGAALIHFAVVQEHLEEWWLYGVFFAVLGTVQLLWGGLALADEELLAPRLFAAGNVAVLVLWLVSRTTGLPVGPEPREAEPVGTADVMSLRAGSGRGRAARAHCAATAPCRGVGAHHRAPARSCRDRRSRRGRGDHCRPSSDRVPRKRPPSRSARRARRPAVAVACTDWSTSVGCTAGSERFHPPSTKPVHDRQAERGNRGWSASTGSRVVSVVPLPEAGVWCWRHC
jgi:hypothetical protein